MTSFADDEAQLRNWLIYYLVTNVGCSPDQIDPDLPLNELGVGSRDAVVLAGELSELLRRQVSPVEIWQTPTINSLADALVNPDAEALRPASGAVAALNEPIAVIGLGCRLPGDVNGPGRCGTSSSSAAARSRQCRKSGGRPSMTGHPRRLRHWPAPRGGARS